MSRRDNPSHYDAEDEDDRVADRPDAHTSDEVAEVIGKIDDCNSVSWCRSSRAWEVELTLKDGTETTLYLSEAELRELADAEDTVAGAWETDAHTLSDAAERAAERRQMGFCNF